MDKSPKGVHSNLTSNKIRYSFVLTMLCFFSIAMCVTANIIGGIFINIPFLVNWGVCLSTGGIIFPLIYVVSDVISEVYGYRISRWNAWITLLVSLFVSYGTLFFTQVIPHPGFQVDLQTAFKTCFSSSAITVIASILSSVMGAWVNDLIFQWFKHKDGKEKFAKRKLISSALGEFVDTAIFTSIVVGTLTITEGHYNFVGVFKTILVYYPFKYLIEVVTEPLAYKLACKVRSIEGDGVFEDRNKFNLFGFEKA